MAQTPVNRSASNYMGKGGKTNVQMQGQTDSGSYGSDVDASRRTPAPPTDVRPQYMASGPQSFTDGLQTLASDAMRLATLPDADPVFCMKLAQAVVAKARAPQGQQHAGQPAPPGAPSPGGPGAPGPGIGPSGMPGGGPGGAPANGAMPTLGAPTMGPGPSAGLNPRANNGDEIRRMIAGATG